jgi:predicted kinase
MTEKTVELLVGVPAAGKSTWLKANRRPTTVVISSDDVITDLAAKQGMTYDQGFSKFIGRASGIVKAKYREALNDGMLHIVVDRTNLSPASRKAWIKDAAKKGYRVNAVVFPTPDDAELTKRLASRPGKTIPDHVMTSMKGNFVMPTADEGIDEITVNGE